MKIRRFILSSAALGAWLVGHCAGFAQNYPTNIFDFGNVVITGSPITLSRTGILHNASRTQSISFRTQLAPQTPFVVRSGSLSGELPPNTPSYPIVFGFEAPTNAMASSNYLQTLVMTTSDPANPGYTIVLKARLITPEPKNFSKDPAAAVDWYTYIWGMVPPKFSLTLPFKIEFQSSTGNIGIWQELDSGNF